MAFIDRLTAMRALAARNGLPTPHGNFAGPGGGPMLPFVKYRRPVQSVSWPGMGGPTTTLAEALAAYQAAVGPAMGKSGVANPHLNTGAGYVNPHLNAGGQIPLAALTPRQPEPPVWRWY